MLREEVCESPFVGWVDSENPKGSIREVVQ